MGMCVGFSVHECVCAWVCVYVCAHVVLGFV